jgi:hypothetical protein
MEFTLISRAAQFKWRLEGETEIATAFPQAVEGTLGRSRR